MLDYRLITPRDQISLQPVKTESVREVGKIRPLIISDAETDLKGYASGNRSAVLMYAGSLIKIKGCAIEESAFEGSDYYKEGRRYIGRGKLREATDIKGGQLKGNATNELQRTDEINRLLREYGFSTVHEPIGTIDYGIEFAEVASMAPSLNLRRFVDEYTFATPAFKKRMWENRGVREVAASAMEIKGDTRLAEIALLPCRDSQKEFELAYRLGLTAGAQFKIFSDHWFWYQNAHIGNYVIFEDSGWLEIQMMDFEDTAQRNLVSGLVDKALGGEERWLSAIFGSFDHNIGGYVGIEKHGKPARADFKNGFFVGFHEGKNDPGKRQRIPLELLEDALEIPDQGWLEWDDVSHRLAE